MRLNTTTPIMIAAIACSMLFGACTDPSPLPKNYVGLIDISGSAIADLEANLAGVEVRLLRTMGPKDAVTLLAIDDASETAAIPLFQLDLSALDFVDPNLPVTVRQKVADRKRAQYVDSVLAGFASNVRQAVDIRRASAGLTDIFGALTVAKRRVKPGYVNYLIVLSDMQHESTGFEFDVLLAQGADLRDYIEKAPAIEVPFEHVMVFTGNNAGMSQPDFHNIKAFWLGWCERNHVPLRDYTSGRIELDLAQVK